MQAPFVKDLPLFFREPSQWAQLLLVLMLLAVYFLNLSLVSADIEIEHQRAIVTLLNFGLSLFAFRLGFRTMAKREY